MRVNLANQILNQSVKHSKNLVRNHTAHSTTIDLYGFSFIEYHEKWKSSIDNREGNSNPIQRNNVFLSVPTYEGLKMTIYSLKEVVAFLLQNGFDYVLSEKGRQPG